MINKKRVSCYCFNFAKMEKLIPYIENLLIRNDYVIIPGLGGFTLQTQSAKIVSNGIIPPLHTIGFNSRMNFNDGLLATEILRSENISYHEACIQIDSVVENIKLCLNTGNKIQIGKLGYLFLNEERNIIFVSSDKYDFIPSNFGLKTIQVSKHNQNKGREITINLPSKNIFRYAAAIIILLGIFLISPQITDSGKNFDYAGINRSFAFVEEPIENIVSNEIIIEENIIPEIIKAKEYHIVVSCVSDINSAQKYCESLKIKNYTNAQVLSSVKVNRIVIDSFSDKQEAISYLREIRKNNPDFKDAWLHHEYIRN